MGLITNLEVNQLTKLINMSRMVESLYSKLYNLELNNQKETLEYQNQLDYLRIVLDMEKEEYLKLNLDQDKMACYLDFINKKYNLDQDLTDIESIMQGSYEKRNIRRVASRLAYYTPNKNNILCHFISDEVIGHIKKVLNKVNITDVDAINYLNDIDTINTNLYYVFLNTIYQALKNFSNKEDLLKTYYNIIYLYANIEQKMLMNNFNFEENINITNLTLNAKLIQNDKLYSLGRYLIDKLLAIPNEELVSKEKIRFILVCESLFRSCLTLIDPMEHEILFKYYLDIVSEKPDYSVCRGAILSDFNMTFEENDKIKVIELK